jgi:hypothetical protein
VLTVKGIMYKLPNFFLLSSSTATGLIRACSLHTWTTGLVDLYWNAERARSTSIGKSEFPWSKLSVSRWNSANPATRRWSCHTTSCTCLLSSNSSLTNTSERRRANLVRASCLHRRINLATNMQDQTYLLCDTGAGYAKNYTMDSSNLFLKWPPLLSFKTFLLN